MKKNLKLYNDIYVFSNIYLTGKKGIKKFPASPAIKFLKIFQFFLFHTNTC